MWLLALRSFESVVPTQSPYKVFYSNGCILLSFVPSHSEAFSHVCHQNMQLSRKKSLKPCPCTFIKLLRYTFSRQVENLQCSSISIHGLYLHFFPSFSFSLKLTFFFLLHFSLIDNLIQNFGINWKDSYFPSLRV